MTWESETSGYLSRLRGSLARFDAGPCYPPNIPNGPFDTPPTELQSLVHRSITFYGYGVWARGKETIEALTILWSEGYMSSGATLARLLFEIWGASRLMSDGLQAYINSKELECLSKTVNKLFEGVRSEVLLPWGSPAAEKPIHVMDAIRSLQKTDPEGMQVYEYLCESAHANLPRFMEWWHLGKAGDNWSNQTVQKRGHLLLERTATAVEMAASGMLEELRDGMRMCGEIY